MEQRLKNLEDLSELITKEIVQQNKSMIEMNKNLLSEIKAMRETYAKQDEDFEEFKNLLKKIYELNKQNGASQNLMQMPLPGLQHPPYSTQSSTSNQNLPPSMLSNLINNPQNNLNNSFAADQVNQSMLNNVSFQSERTPLNNNQNASSYSIPSSASAMMLQQQQQQQFTPYMNHQLATSQQQLSSSSAKSTASFQTVRLPQPQQQQQPPQMLHPNLANNPNFKSIPPQQQQQMPQIHMQQPVPPQQQQQAAKPFSFANLNKPLVVSQNGTDAIKLEQQRQTFNIPPPPPAQTTSTPQPNQSFPVSKFQPAVDTSKPKPPQFQFSPSKPQPEISTGPKPFAQPPFAPPIVPAPASTSAPAPSIFGSSLFKTTTPEKKAPIITTTVPPLFNHLAGITSAQTKTEDEPEETAGANPEDFEPQVDFKPLVKLQQVETKTGEEDEETLLKLRCKLFRFDLKAKDWKEKGLGDIKFLKHKNTGVTRILMRREHVHKICANQRITPTMTIKEESPKQYSWSAIDFSDNEPKTEMLLARFKLVEEATSFKNEFLKAVEASKTLKTPVKDTKAATVAAPVENKLSQIFKSDKWSCKDCYAQNNKEDIKCACCKSIKPGATAEEVSAASAPAATTTNTTGVFSFGLKPAEAKSQVSPVKPFSFGAGPPAGDQTKQTILFGAPMNNQPKLDFSSKLTGSPKKAETPAVPIFGSKPMPSFEKLAASSGSAFGTASSGSVFGATPLGSVFGGGFKPADTAAKPLSIFQKPQEPAQTGEAAEDDTAANENPEEYEPQVDFKPVVKLTAVETKTGEEDEIAVFKSRCKLYRFDSKTKEWKEKGLGDMKILKRKDQNNMYRILMRREQVLKLCANHRLTSDLVFEIQDEKQVRWHAEDYSEGSGSHELLAARFKTENEAKLFKKECENAVAILKSEPATSKPQTKTTTDQKPAAQNSCANLKSSLADMFKTDGWKCDACYAPNKADVVNCACCSSLKPGATEEEAKPADKALVSNLGTFSIGSKDTKAAPIIFGSGAPATKATDGKTPTFDFGSKPASQTTASLFGASSNTTSIFGAPSNTTSIFGDKKSDVSFANLAQKTQPTGFGGGFTGGFGSLNSQAKPLFGTAAPAKTNEPEAADKAEGASENPEEYEPQVDFKPLVKLQEVETKTGEEDEEVMFKNRCKLYRFNPELKEWKEKGVGDIKVLRHKLKNTYRVLMRREQIHKLCANHRINPSIKLENLNEKQLTWHVQDYSEDQPRSEILLAKFRHEEEATKFRTIFQEVQKALKLNPSDATVPSIVKTEAAQNKISTLVNKQAAGSWKCGGDNDEVLLVDTVEATKEQKDKARQFQLPDNFYLYEKCEDCKGCRGCEE